MSEIAALQGLLASGADVAVLLFAYFLWRLDRRLLAVELLMAERWKSEAAAKEPS